MKRLLIASMLAVAITVIACGPSDAGPGGGWSQMNEDPISIPVWAQSFRVAVHDETGRPVEWDPSFS